MNNTAVKEEPLNPGLYDVPFTEYKELEATNNSYLSRLGEVPAKALVARPDTASLDFGRAAHTFILEGYPAFQQEYAVIPEGMKKGNNNAYKAFIAENIGKAFIKLEEFTHIINMRIAVYDHPKAAALLDGAETEKTIIFREPETGILCKTRIDALNKRNKAVVDLKTARSADERAFVRSIFTYNYHVQGSFYRDSVNAVLDGRVTKHPKFEVFVIIAVEKEPPYQVGVFHISEALLQVGRERYIELLKLNEKCKVEGFPHYQDPQNNGGMITVDVPGWMEL